MRFNVEKNEWFLQKQTQWIAWFRFSQCSILHDCFMLSILKPFFQSIFAWQSSILIMWSWKSFFWDLTAWSNFGFRSRGRAPSPWGCPSRVSCPEGWPRPRWCHRSRKPGKSGDWSVPKNGLAKWFVVIEFNEHYKSWTWFNSIVLSMLQIFQCWLSFNV